MFVKGQTEKQNKTDQAMVTASIVSSFKVILDVSKKTILGFMKIDITISRCNPSINGLLLHAS